MKRFLTILMAVMMTVVAMAQSSGIVLSYNKGKELKFFTHDQIAKAIEAAEVNDTIYFGPGTYSLSGLQFFTSDGYRPSRFKKPLTFIGCGSVNGTTFHSIEGIQLVPDTTIDYSKRTYSFEGINFTTSYTGENTKQKLWIIPVGDLKQVKLANVKIAFGYDDREDSSVENLIIDGGEMQYLNLEASTTGTVCVNNTYITQVLSGGSDIQKGVGIFDHCYINVMYYSFIGLVQHSLVQQVNAGIGASLEDCGWRYGNGAALKTGCITLTTDAASVNSNPATLGDCKDGTPYGTSGGTTPYTTYPQYPTADISGDPETGKAKSHVDYDPLNKKLTITVKRLGE